VQRAVLSLSNRGGEPPEGEEPSGNVLFSVTNAAAAAAAAVPESELDERSGSLQFTKSSAAPIPMPTITSAQHESDAFDHLSIRGDFIGSANSRDTNDVASSAQSDAIVMPLSAFYPPLPSYEESDASSTQDEGILHKSPSFFPTVDQTIDIEDKIIDVSRGKMSIDAQMYLHGQAQDLQGSNRKSSLSSESSEDGMTPRSAGSFPKQSPVSAIQPTLLIPKYAFLLT